MPIAHGRTSVEPMSVRGRGDLMAWIIYALLHVPNTTLARCWNRR